MNTSILNNKAHDWQCFGIIQNLTLRFASSPFSTSLQASRTFAPRLAKSSAASSPIPLLDPVINATFPSILMSSITNPFLSDWFAAMRWQDIKSMNEVSFKNLDGDTSSAKLGL